MSDPVTRPDYATLADWLEGRLDPARTASVAAAVEADPTLQQTVAWLRRFIDTADAVPMLAPPPAVHQRLMQHFQRWSAERDNDKLDMLELDAALLFDSREDLATAGLRSTGDVDASVHLVFGCDVADIAVDVVPEAGGGVRLSGQVLADDNRARGTFAVSASGPDGQRIAIDGDALGRFNVGSVPATTNALSLCNGQVTLRMTFDLGSGR
jgi:hypothetical protein